MQMWFGRLSLIVAVALMFGCSDSGDDEVASTGGNSSVQEVKEVQTVEPRWIALPAGEEPSAQPLIHSGKLFVLTKGSDNQVHLHAWDSETLEEAFTVDFSDDTDATPNLAVIANSIFLYTTFDGVASVYGYPMTVDGTPGLYRVSTSDGSIDTVGCSKDGFCGDFIGGIAGLGDTEDVMAFGSTPVGPIFEVEENLFFPITGSAFNACSGELSWYGLSSWTNTFGTFSGTVVSGNKAYMMSLMPPALYSLKLDDLQGPVLEGYSDSPVLFETDLSEDGVMGSAVDLLDPIVFDGKVYLVRGRLVTNVFDVDYSDIDWEANPQGPELISKTVIDLLSLDAVTGELLETTELLSVDSDDTLAAQLLFSEAYTRSPAIVDGVLYVPIRRPDASTEFYFNQNQIDWHTTMVAVDLSDNSIKWRSELGAGSPWVIPAGDRLLVVDHSTVEVPERSEIPAEYATAKRLIASGFRVVELDKATGSAVLALTSPDFEGKMAIGAYTPLLDNETLYQLVMDIPDPETGETAGYHVAVIPVGLAGSVLQWRFNNKGNPVMGSAAAGDEEVGEPASPAVDSDNAPVPDGMDTPAGDILLHEDLEALEPLYLAVLNDISFSSNGEDGSDVGEGMLKYLVVDGCVKSRTRFPGVGYLPLPEGGATFSVNAPIYAAQWETILQSNARLMLGYTAVEHDVESVVDKFVSFATFAVKLAVAIIAEDPCGILTAVLDYGQEITDSVDEYYGSPYLYVSADDTEGNTYGIPEGGNSQAFQVAGAEDTSDVSHTLGDASDLVSTVCGVGNIIQNPTAFGSMKNVAGSLLGDDPKSRHTTGNITLYKASTFAIKSLKVDVKDVTVTGNSPLLVPGNLTWRLGIVGSGLATDPAPEGSAKPGSMPFGSFVTGESPELPLEDVVTIYDANFTSEARASAIYVELNVRGDQLVSLNGGPETLGFIGRTWLLDDARYGAWERDGDLFTKTVVLPFHTAYGSGSVTLSMQMSL